jgi:hypothetical protein
VIPVRLLSLALAAVLACSSRSLASEATCPAEVEALLTEISATPPTPKTVVEVVRHPATADAEVARRVVAVLWHRGGYAAARGLQSLARHRDPEVRVEALRGVAAVGLRVHEGLANVEQASRSRDSAERAAAIAALGRVGNGNHVPMLLVALRTDDKPTLQAAYRALTDLTKAKVPWQPARWEHWWAEVEKTARGRIRTALDCIEAGDCPTSTASGREVLDAYGWIEAASVEQAVKGWVRSSIPRLRIEGYRAARTLRLGDLAEEVGSAFRYDRDPTAWPEGRTSATALGIATEGVTPPPTRSR